MVSGWPIRLLRVLWIAALVCSGILAELINHNYFGYLVWPVFTVFYFIVWIIAFLIPLQYILLNSINPKVLIEDFIK